MEVPFSKANTHSKAQIKPMPLWESLLVLAVISLLGLVCFYGLRPWLERAGLQSYPAYLLSISVAFTVMLAWAVGAFFLEGHPRTLAAFLRRVHLHTFNPRLLLWALGLGLFMFLATILFSPLIALLAEHGLVPLPAGIPDYLDPTQQRSLAQMKAAMLAQGVLPWIPLVLLLNICAEELFWRGMLFPRQEMRHGAGTFLLHGLSWGISHLFQYWLLLPILIAAVALAYVFQRTHNTWVGIIAHAFNNALPFVIMLFVAV